MKSSKTVNNSTQMSDEEQLHKLNEERIAMVLRRETSVIINAVSAAYVKLYASVYGSN